MARLSMARRLLALALLVGLPRMATAQVSTAEEICAPDADPCEVTKNVLVEDGSVLDFGIRSVIIRAGGRLTSPGGLIVISCQSLTVERNGQINLRGTAGETGGSLDIEVADQILVSGVIDLGGSGAGSFSANFVRFNLQSGTGFRGQLLLDGADADADGGALELTGNEVTLDGEIRANSGSAGLGGDIIVDAANTLSVNGLINADGGESDGGSVSFRSGGDILFGTNGLMRANGSLSGDGGDITLESGVSTLGTGVGVLRMQGTIQATGGTSTEEGGGDGGLIELVGAQSCQLTGRITALSGQPDGTGGDIMITCSDSDAGDLQMDAEVDVHGVGPRGSGGAVDMRAPLGNVTVTKKIDAGGTDGGAGTITVTSGGNLTVSNSITSSAPAAGSGGTISLVARTGASAALRLTNTGSVIADGGQGGSVTLDACQAFVDLTQGVGTQSAAARGTQGRITITAVTSSRVGGRMTAGNSIAIVYRDLVPLIESTAVFSPAAAQVLDENLLGCGTPAPTRTRTRTTTPSVTPTAPPSHTPTRTPTITPTRATPTQTFTRTRTGTPTPSPSPSPSPSPKPTPDGPFDTNCSGVAEPDETSGINVAIFDVAMADMCPPADQNGDGVVTAADQTALAINLAESP